MQFVSKNQLPQCFQSVRNFQKTLIRPQAPIIAAVELIDHSAMQIALVVDEDKKLLGTITDGDLRRAFLNGKTLDAPLTEVMNPNPIVVHQGLGSRAILSIMEANSIHQLPVVDEEGHVIGLEIIDELLPPKSSENLVVLMAGGLGSRLHPLTENTPKPLLEVSGRPIIETIIERFVAQGFQKFAVSVQYKADLFREKLGNGERWGIEIDYLVEDQKLGTAGSLSLIPEKPKSPIIVMNADLLTSLNFRSLLEFHVENKASATMCLHEYTIEIPYGVAETDGQRLVSVVEKPEHKYLVNAGIYILNPDCLDYIPQEQKFDMTHLFDAILSAGEFASVFPIREYWLDVGQRPDFDRANREYNLVFR